MRDAFFSLLSINFHVQKRNAFDQTFAHFRAMFFANFRRINRQIIPQASSGDVVHHNDALDFALGRVENVRSDETDDVFVAQVDRRLVEDCGFVLEGVFALREKVFDRYFVEAEAAGENCAEATFLRVEK